MILLKDIVPSHYLTPKGQNRKVPNNKFGVAFRNFLTSVGWTIETDQALIDDLEDSSGETYNDEHSQLFYCLLNHPSEPNIQCAIDMVSCDTVQFYNKVHNGDFSFDLDGEAICCLYHGDKSYDRIEIDEVNGLLIKDKVMALRLV